jgi:hypothetical protein
MSEIGERKLRNLNIDTRNIIFRKKNSKKARSIISVLKPAQLPESAQLPVLSEFPLPQPEIPAESQFLFSTENISHSTGNALTTISLQFTARRSPFLV